MTAMFAVQLAFTDDSARLGLRPAHRERLAGLAADGRLLAGGPWSDDSGALLLFLVETREALEEIMATDPYYSAPGVSVTSVREWLPVTRHPSLDDL
jgi:uncharacterized protein YciI